MMPVKNVFVFLFFRRNHHTTLHQDQFISPFICSYEEGESSPPTKRRLESVTFKPPPPDVIRPDCVSVSHQQQEEGKGPACNACVPSCFPPCLLSAIKSPGKPVWPGLFSAALLFQTRLIHRAAEQPERRWHNGRRGGANRCYGGTEE